MYTLRNEGTWHVITAERDGKRVFFTGLYHAGNVPQLTDNPNDAAQFEDADEADDWITRPAYKAGLRVARFAFKVVADVDPATKMPWLDNTRRPIGTLVMTANEVT